MNATFSNQIYSLNITSSSLGCNEQGQIDLTIEMITNENMTIQTQIAQVLENTTTSLGYELVSVGKCDNLTGKYLLI